MRRVVHVRDLSRCMSARIRLAKLPEMELGEDAMLDGTARPAAPRIAGFSCQLVMTPPMDGLVVDMPETQT